MLKHISDGMYGCQPLALMQRVMGHQDYSLLPLRWNISIYIRKSVTQFVAVPFLVPASYSKSLALLSRLIMVMILSRFHFHLHQQTLSRGHKNDLHLPKMVRTACGTRYGVVISPTEYCLGSK